MLYLPLHLIVSLMNRLNKPESAVFFFWMQYFQRIPLSDILTAVKGTHCYILFVVTTAGVVLFGGPKK